MAKNTNLQNLTGEKLAKLRKKYQLTQKELAQALGISRQTLIKIEQG